MKSALSRSTCRWAVMSCTITTSRSSASPANTAAWLARIQRGSPSGRMIRSSTFTRVETADICWRAAWKASTGSPSMPTAVTSRDSGRPTAAASSTPTNAVRAGLHSWTTPLPSSTRIPSLDCSTTTASLLVCSCNRVWYWAPRRAAASALAAALRGAQYQTRLHEQTSKLAVVVEQSSDGILVLDGNGVVQLWSPALTALVGVDEAAAVGRPLSRLVTAVGIDGEPVDAFQTARQQMSAVSTRVNVELRIIRPDGEPRWIRANHAAVFAGEALLRDVVIVHDMTAQRQVERLKADFIATVSHELRTPITPIKGYADLLRRHGETMSSEKRAECVRVISERADHLARLVDDLLMASKITHSGGPLR